MKNSKPAVPQSATPWYADGLSFACTQCGDCCSGEPGYVYVGQEEIDAMADALSMKIQEFEAAFVRPVGRERSLKEYDDGDCILLDRTTRRCRVYKARPTQCRTWPFWDSNLARPADWADTCAVCPGAGTGRVYSLDEIETARKAKSV